MISSPDQVDINITLTSRMALNGDWNPQPSVEQQKNDETSQCLSEESCDNCSAWTIGAVDVPRTLPITSCDGELSGSLNNMFISPSGYHVTRRKPQHSSEPTSTQSSGLQPNGDLSAQTQTPTTLSSLSQPAHQDENGTSKYSTASAASSAKPEETSQFVGSLYQDRIINQPSQAVDAVLAAACETLNFDIAELWLRTGPKTHQLINTHVRPTSLEHSIRKQVVDVYYGARSSERVHNLSPALCKRAKEAQDVVWVTSFTEHGAAALRCSISDVRTAVAVPVCHENSRTNMTVIFFSIRRAMMKPTAVEFLVHMSLATANACVNPLAEEVFMADRTNSMSDMPSSNSLKSKNVGSSSNNISNQTSSLSKSEHIPVKHAAALQRQRSSMSHIPETTSTERFPKLTVSGASLDLRWSNLSNVEYLTDGGNNWIHTAVLNRRPVVVKWLKPECQDLVLAINEIEDEIEIHSKLQHKNIVSLCGAGLTSKGSRFMVLERLDGGTLTQVLGYDTRIRDRRRRFWKRKQFSYIEVLKFARSVAEALAYLHSDAIPGGMVLHRDLKPDNIGFTLDGSVKLIDFGLARILENADPNSDDLYEMSGETGSLRYMAPEVADGRPYNHKADIYSFGIILWEVATYKKPFDGMDKSQFYERVIHGGERPPINKKWPIQFSNLISACWSFDPESRPTAQKIVTILEELSTNEKVGTRGSVEKKNVRKRISALIDRHSTWF